MQEADVALGQHSVRAGIAGTIQQFQLRSGDVVNPFVRPAGILGPRDQEEGVFVAGFGQLTAQVIHPGMIGELACAHPSVQDHPGCCRCRAGRYGGRPVQADGFTDGRQ
ncbi:hypothetical protein [Martelella sp. AD-3]|uniref:hypothetical protein n=1 Tax=Martelella sp. AD-3 TaxID=686597 RepID=UPI001267D817|nr:hypothetical protein [Martelella sp. AD-3]